MVIIMIALDGRLLEGSVHPLHLVVAPWMIHFAEAMFNIIVFTNPIEDIGKVYY